ncbi:hypothetical protein [Sphingobacterium sp. LRF_L2]|uniref:hypothetical protein n=1 Tax=Sphingobacterium sp. LRF_L2 TaxID=3369421 RepID=UPI003F6389C5
MNKILAITFMALLLSIMIPYKSNSQIIDNEQAHSNIKWRQIDTEHYRLLFPQTFEQAAKKLATELPYLRRYSSNSLSISPRKITLILQGNHISQNGYVQLAPRKSEFYPVPSSTADNQEWLPNLALHELRHVSQFDKLTGRIRGPFFEQLALALYGLNLPAWYFEGDAVQVETLYSSGGRGRLPSWDMPLRANILSGREYSFNKYVLGSFKDNVPSHYTIGFFMNTYLTNNFGLESHQKILEDMHTKLLRPFNFRQAVKHVAGIKPNKLFSNTIEELHQKWQRELTDSSVTAIETPKSNFPSDYLLPQTNYENKLFVLKSSPQSVNEIVYLDSNTKEHHIIKTGIQITPYFHMRDDLIVWDEYRKHPRFGKQTYNIVHTYNVKTKKLRTISKKSRYYSPVLHPNENAVAVVEVDLANKSKLLLLNSDNGNIIDSIHCPTEVHIQQPKFNIEGDKIIAIAVSPQGTNLIEFNLKNHAYRYLLPWANQQLERPFYHRHQIIFKAHFDGVDNIYALGQDSLISKITTSKFGAFNPFVDANDTLFFNDYQYNGYKLAKQSLTAISKKIQVAPSPYIRKTLAQVDFSDEKKATIDSVEVKKYSSTAHLFNFHSLSISSTNFESFENYMPGLFWLSNDVLNTTQIKLGYEFDTDISKSTYSAEVAYKRYLPVFTIKYANRGLVGNAVSGNNSNEITMYDYRDHHTTMDISIPLSVYRRNTVYSYGANFGTSYTKRYNVSLPLKNFNDIIAFPLNYQLYLNKNNMRSKMDLAPRWGQNLSITYRHLPFEQDLSGQILSVRTNFYFPGIWMNHSLQLRLAAQKSSGRYEGSYDIPMVSAWGHFQSPIVHNTAMINYRLPLFYPDWSLGNLAYIKRFQGLLFSDFQNIHKSTAPKSFGLGISADFNVFRYILPDINVAAKLTYLNDNTTAQNIIPTFGLSYSY